MKTQRAGHKGKALLQLLLKSCKSALPLTNIPKYSQGWGAGAPGAA